MVSQFDHDGFDHSDVAIERTTQGTAGKGFSLDAFSVVHENLPEYKTPKRLRQGKAAHGERETEQAGQNHRLSANMIRESTPMEDRARFRYEEQGLLEAKSCPLSVVAMPDLDNYLP